MAKKKLTPKLPLKLGDHVKVRYWPEVQAQIVEERGPLGPKDLSSFAFALKETPIPVSLMSVKINSK